MSDANDHLALTAAGTPFHPRSARNVLIVLALMALMVTYVETMVIPAFKAFSIFFDYAPATSVVWIVSAYLLVGTVATPIFGKLGDKYGKKQVLVLVMGLYAVAVSLAGFSPNIGAAFGIDRANQIYVLIGVRAFQGLGMGMFPLAFAMIPEVYPAARVGQAQGIVSAMFASGAAIGLVGGGWISYNWGWQLTYHTVIPVAVLLAVLAYLILHESPTRSPHPIDFPGIASLGFALGTLMFGLTEGTYWGWSNGAAVHWGALPWGVPEFFLLSVLGLVFFLLWEPRAPFPVVSFAALKQRNVWVSNVNGVFVGMGMFLVFVALTILGEYQFAPGFDLTEFQMGLISVPAALSMLALGPVWGSLVSRWGPKPVMLLGFGVMGAGAAGLATFNSTVLDLILFSMPTLAGNVAVLIAMSNVIVLSVPPKELGVQTGMNQTFRNLGSAVGPVVAATVTASYMTTILVGPPGYQQAAPTYQVLGFQLVFAITAAVSVVGLLLSLALRNYRFRADGSRASHPTEAPTGSALRGEEPAVGLGTRT